MRRSETEYETRDADITVGDIKFCILAFFLFQTNLSCFLVNNLLQMEVPALQIRCNYEAGVLLRDTSSLRSEHRAGLMPTESHNPIIAVFINLQNFHSGLKSRFIMLKPRMYFGLFCFHYKWRWRMPVLAFVQSLTFFPLQQPIFSPYFIQYALGASTILCFCVLFIHRTSLIRIT